MLFRGAAHPFDVAVFIALLGKRFPEKEDPDIHAALIRPDQTLKAVQNKRRRPEDSRAYQKHGAKRQRAETLSDQYRDLGYHQKCRNRNQTEVLYDHQPLLELKFFHSRKSFPNAVFSCVYYSIGFVDIGVQICIIFRFLRSDDGSLREPHLGISRRTFIYIAHFYFVSALLLI